MCGARLMVVAVWLALSVSAQRDVTSLAKRGGRHYCGETLNRALMLICDSIYKRSGSGYNAPPPDGDWILYDDRPYFPFRPRNAAIALISRPYKRRGVADECCSKPCTLSELSSYCGSKPRR